MVDNSQINLDSCILAFNHGSAFSTALSGSVAMGCSVVYGNEGGDDYPDLFTDLGNNFSSDLLFCTMVTGDLLSNSPCLPDNHPDGNNCGLIGGSSEVCDN